MKKSISCRILFTSIAALYIALFCFLAFTFFLPRGKAADSSFGFLLARPAFAQESTAFPADEVGISAYVNAGQSIDLSKAKSALRGVEAEGSNYVIGIIELPGNPEDEFPHMYISSDGWIMAYYSKFAPSSRIFQWYGYEGGTITTTTLQNAISKICPTIGINFSQIKTNLKYYHFGFPQATTMVIAIERLDLGDEDKFEFSIPFDIIVYEGSWSFWGQQGPFGSMTIDNVPIADSYDSPNNCSCGFFEARYLSPGSPRIITISSYPDCSASHWVGASVVFIY
jgi:hypothetical protein